MNIPYHIIVAYWIETNVINDPNNSEHYFLPDWYLPYDLFWYKYLTTGGALGDVVGGIVIVGWNTYISMPEAAWKNRIAIVLTSEAEKRSAELEKLKRGLPIFAGSMEEAITIADHLADQYKLSCVWVAGGGQIYKDAMNPDSALGKRVTTVYATEVTGGIGKPGTAEFPKVSENPSWKIEGEVEEFPIQKANEAMRAVRSTFKGTHTNDYRRVIYRKKAA